MEEGVEELANTSEPSALTFLLPFACIGHDDELNIEELLKLQPHVGSSKFVGCRGVVCSTKGFVERHEVQSLNNIGGQRFGQRPGELAEEGTCEAFHRT